MSTPILGVGTDVTLIVKEIDVKMYAANQFIYTIKCVGTESVSFIDVLKSLLMQANAQNQVADSTVLQMLILIEEMITVSDTLNTPTITSAPYKWGPDANAGRWNFATWG